MRSYCKVAPRLWTGTLGKRLRGDVYAQCLAAYLVSGPHANMIGLYHLPVVYIAGDLGWTQAVAKKALDRLVAEGFVQYDEPSERLWVVEHARIEFGDGLRLGDNRIKGIENQLADHAGSPLAAAFFRRFGGAFNLSAEFLGRPSEGASEELRNQEQEQEQEQESTSCSEPAAPPSEPPDDPVVWEFPVTRNGDKPWPLRASKVREYHEAFPDLDIPRELRAARQWCIDNRAKRKTPSGMASFLTAWLTRAQNNGRGGGPTPFRREPEGGSSRYRRLA